MSNISQFTTKFRIQKNNNSGSTPEKPTIKRVRLVCTQCQKSKLRCDRNSPCGNCVKRDGVCTYPVQERAPTHQSGSGSRINGINGMNGVAEDRLMHLESMVKMLMENQRKQAAVLPVVDVLSSTDAVGGREPRVEEDTTTYSGSTHWSAILDDIHELKAALGVNHQSESEGGEKGIPTTSNPLSQNEIIFGSPNSTLQQIISQYLPSKLHIDQLLAIYFQGEGYIIPFIHAQQFQRQYREFWQDTTAVNPLWLSMLFSLCCLGSLVGATASSPQSRTVNDFHSLHTGAAKCLVLGQYHLPQKFCLTALALYCHCKNLRTLDPSREVGTIVSMIIRMAYEMGYHRDPDHLGPFTPFEGEMRRRFWASCRQMDLMISFQLGLPSNICLEDCDTLPPRHLLESDFDEDCKVLPAARSENEWTKLLWFVVKERQMISFSKVCRDALSFSEKSEAEIRVLDREIRDMQDSIPPVLRENALADSLSDPPFLIVTRLYLDFIPLKSLCVLHRKYMTHGSTWSTQVCISAGCSLVRKFIEMYNAFKPGGLLASDRWMLSNFTVNDFLMGTMLLCLVVHTRWKKLLLEVITTAVEEQILDLLEQAFVICGEREGESKDVRRVKSAILYTLNRAKIQKSSHEEVTPVVLPMEDGFRDGGANLLLPPWYGYLQGDEEAFGLLDPYNFGGEVEDMDWSLFNTGL